MLGFVQSWFTPGANPIGVDFGSDSLRMAQVEPIGVPPAVGTGAGLPGAPGVTGASSDFRLVAAARADVPSVVRHDPAARMAFFADTVRELWSSGNFRGRKAILSLPAFAMTIQHLRVPRMDEEALKKALPWEARGKLPYDPTHAVLRHLVAGEIHQDGEQKNEVILMAAQRELVNALLAACAKAKLDVVGMNVEPLAVVECFGHVYRRRTDAEVTNLYVDIGCLASRAFVARGQQILFARTIPVGGDHFTRAVASALKIGFDDARVLRIKLCHAQQAPPAQPPAQPPPAAKAAQPAKPAADSREDATAVAPVASPAPPAMQADAEAVAAACREPVTRLVEELALCRRYHEATFPALPVERLIFVGGEARHRGVCQEIARGLELAAQIGDPMARMARVSNIGIESGIDRRLPQPDWTVAIGLSMGPVGAPTAAEAVK